jgi:hypothetical protein
MLAPPAWAIPPLRRIDLAGFEQMIRAMSPITQVIIPEIFHPFSPKNPRQRKGRNGIMKS